MDGTYLIPALHQVLNSLAQNIFEEEVNNEGAHDFRMVLQENSEFTQSLLHSLNVIDVFKCRSTQNLFRTGRQAPGRRQVNEDSY